MLRRAAFGRNQHVVLAVTAVNKRDFMDHPRPAPPRVEDQTTRAVPIVTDLAARGLVLPNVRISEQTIIRHGAYLAIFTAPWRPHQPGPVRGGSSSRRSNGCGRHTTLSERTVAAHIAIAADGVRSYGRLACESLVDSARPRWD